MHWESYPLSLPAQNSSAFQSQNLLSAAPCTEQPWTNAFLDKTVFLSCKTTTLAVIWKLEFFMQNELSLLLEKCTKSCIISPKLNEEISPLVSCLWNCIQVGFKCQHQTTGSAPVKSLGFFHIEPISERLHEEKASQLPRTRLLY